MVELIALSLVELMNDLMEGLGVGSSENCFKRAVTNSKNTRHSSVSDGCTEQKDSRAMCTVQSLTTLILNSRQNVHFVHQAKLNAAAE